MKTIAFTRVEWVMLEELARKSRQKPQDYLKSLIISRYEQLK
jgi:hypothetical protein